MAGIHHHDRYAAHHDMTARFDQSPGGRVEPAAQRYDARGPGRHPGPAPGCSTAPPAAGQAGEGFTNLEDGDRRQQVIEQLARALELLRQAYDTYVVVAGDTLSGIAARHGTTWQELYELNRDVVGDDPDRIEVGMELRLPPGAYVPVVDGTQYAPPIIGSNGAPTAGPAPAPDPGTGSSTGGATGVSQDQVDAARAANVSTDGLVPQSLRNLERANQYGLRLTGGVGGWNEWHMDGSSIDVGNYDGRGFVETPEMRAFADEMYELGRSGATGPDGGLLVTHVVYAGMKAGASTGWQWVPVSQPDDITQGHWDHVHVETDSFV
jgi:hypothetical protein